jgi:hypothetical protein
LIFARMLTLITSCSVFLWSASFALRRLSSVLKGSMVPENLSFWFDRTIFGLYLLTGENGELAAFKPEMEGTREIWRVGTRSHLIRLSTSDGHIGCTASDGKCTPARPASQVWKRLMDVLRWTRRNTHTIRGAAPGVNQRTSCRESRGSASLPSRMALRGSCRTLRRR